MAWRVLRRGGSRSWRQRCRRTFAVWERVSGGQMAARRALARRQVRRQREGWPLALRSPGGRFGQFARAVIDQQGKKKMTGYPCSSQSRIFGWQPVEVEDRFQSLEGQLDLPSHAIEGGEQVRWEGGGIERGDEDQVLGGLKGAGIGAVLVLSGGIGGFLARGGGDL